VLSLQCAAPTYPKVCIEYAESLGKSAPDTRVIQKKQSRMLFGLGQKQCVKWEEDRSAKPRLKFRLPKKLF
jgi:hypothetical protein